MTCPSADRLCSIPDRDGPPRPPEVSSSELPPSKPGLKLGRLLSPTCTKVELKKRFKKYILKGTTELLSTGFLRATLTVNYCSPSLTSCLEVLGSSCVLLLLLLLFLLADSSSSSVSSSLAGQESIPVAARRTSGIWKSS